MPPSNPDINTTLRHNVTVFLPNYFLGLYDGDDKLHQVSNNSSQNQGGTTKTVIKPEI